MIEHAWPALFDLHPQPMWIVNPLAGTILDANPSAARHFGYPREKFRSLPLTQLRARTDIPSLLEAWLCDGARDLGSEPRALGVAAFRTARGDETQVEVWVSAPPGEARDTVLCLLQDVTERVRAQDASRRSDERFVALTHAVDGMIWDYNSVTGEVWRSEGTREIFGAPPSELAAHLETWLSRIHPDDLERVRASFDAAIEDPSTTAWRAEYRFRGPDGAWLDVQDFAAIVRDPHGRTERMIGTMIDASRRTRAEQAMEESEERLRTLFESSLVGIVFGDTDGTILQANDEFLRIVGYDREDLLARRINVREITPPEQISITNRALDAARTGVVAPYEKEYIRKDGTRIPVMVSLSTFQPDGTLGFALVMDLTAMKRAQREAIDHQTRLQALFDNTQDAILLFNQFGYFVAANPAASRLLGYTRDEILQLHMYDMFPDEELAHVREIRNAVLTTGTSEGEVRRRRKDGSIVEVEYRAVANITPGVHLTVLRDISSRKQAETGRREAEQRLAEHQRRLQALFDNSVDGIVLFDGDNRFLDLNPAACEMFGYPRAELIGRPIRLVLPIAEEPAGPGASPPRVEDRVRGVLHAMRRDGAVVDVEARAVANIVPGVHMAVLRDLRERRESERALRSLSGRLLRLQDEERRRLAREIHDSTAQGLAALSLGLGVISRSSERLGEREQRALVDAQAQVEQCARELRTISYLLHPPLLDEMGLASALRVFVDGFAARSEIRISLQVPEMDSRLPRETETALFRIVQECLTNIHRHSGSPTADVRLMIDAESVVLEVSDRGRGMELLTTSSHASELGVGIIGMQERVRQLGGRLEIESGRRGTTVRTVLPRTHP